MDVDSDDAGDPNDLLIFLTDGVQTTDNAFSTPVAQAGVIIDAGNTYVHTGPAALAANAIKIGGTRVPGLDSPIPPIQPFICRFSKDQQALIPLARTLPLLIMPRSRTTSLLR